ncbi:heme lyase CcmF/NrfE family subunit [Granulosicoccus antarcticus]|uniref:Cytochrome c-type biogenesis protein CcmF n=1 Tax=Granulosicoccus antarcticus IMCC3135 TaxID=1192854 RepID=A0A2Z2NTY8_9GAMM|nr:heme lyase CcmF/NrfE family subunit [Granulosicoccus antarcticus]ASJ74946.1 Cytochrome c-type biogenesis protein CcmF [Granulosicoccus antarcticus IMCC3135]
MIPELGHFALILALCTAIVLAVIPMIGSFTGHSGWMDMARPAAGAQLFFAFLAYACLTWSFISHDFSVLYVANTSNLSLPLIYRISGVWGGHEGSILFWCFILTVWTGAVGIFSRSLPQVLLARVLSVLGLISIGFLLFVLLTSNPFERVFPIPLDGASLNPLLQDPGMAIHPPMLYMGYVGFAVAFAFAIAALIDGQLDAATLRWMRPWTNIAWMFLTIGISLGSFWAYYELGWGGWWFWDPVENASFMPWLVGTALIHSLAASEKRGVFKAWTVLLAVLAFSLSLLGTFLVRSGVLTSVHSFAADPTRGLFILLFLGLVVGGSLLLYAVRAHKLTSTASFELISRESALLLNNILLVVACAAVLLGTLYPLFVDALGYGKLSVGEQYFNAVFVPLMLPILLMVGLGAMLNWKRDRLKGRSTTLAVLGIASLVLAALLTTQLLEYRISAVATLALAIWVAASTIYGIFYRFRNQRKRLSAVMHTPAAFWGMSIAHLGLAVFTVGVALTSIYTEEQTVRMDIDGSHTMGGYTFTFKSMEEVRGENYNAAEATFAVERDGQDVGIIKSQKRVYDVRRDGMTEAGIDGGFTRDLFVAMGEPLDGGSAWSVRIQTKPYIRWIWLGTIFMAVGGVLAAVDRRYRRLAVKQSTTARNPGSSLGRGADEKAFANLGATSTAAPGTSES